jgi:hypothetical protein
MAGPSTANVTPATSVVASPPLLPACPDTEKGLGFVASDSVDV